MHRTADSVRPRHQTAAGAGAGGAHHYQNVIPRTTATVGDHNNSTEGGRLYKRPLSAVTTSAKRRRQRIIRRVLFIVMAVPFILFLFLTLVGIISIRSKSSWPSSSLIRKGGAADPMQSFLSHSGQQQQQQQQHQANTDPAERLEKEGHQQAFSAPVVGMFQGLPITYHEVSSTGTTGAGPNSSSMRSASSVHCVGENFRPDTAWMARSCQFRNLCFDMNTSDFVIFQSAQEERLQQRLEKLQQRYQKQQQQQTQCQQQKDGKCQPSLDAQSVVSISSLALQNQIKVSLGSLNNPQWNSADIDRLQWFPKIISHSSMAQPPHGQGYYQLPNDVVWVPFHASSIMMNAGNLVWNDFLSIYTLLSMFDLLGSNSDNSNDNDNDKNKNRRLLLTRHVLEEPPLSATCDLNATSLAQCRILLDKILPAMGIHPPLQFSTNLDYEFTLFQQQQQQQKSHLICARYGAAGIGMLSSSSAAHHHGNGKTREDTLLQSNYFKDTFNMGRGAMLRAFGNFMARNLGIRNDSNLPASSNNEPSIQHSFTLPYKITISIDSSARHYNRDMDHSIQMMARIKTEFAGGGGGGVVDNNDVVLQSFDVHQLTLVEQARIATESAIFVSVCGGGSVMATFLSPGASLIVIHDDEQEQQSGHEQDPQQQPTRIDWDLLSNAGYFRAHWLPIQRNHDLSWDIASLVSLMRRELDRIRKQE